jgi:hypothetical protein
MRERDLLAQRAIRLGKVGLTPRVMPVDATTLTDQA